MALGERARSPAQDPLAGPLGEFVASWLAEGNTDDFIKWDKLQDRLKQMPPGLSDLERVELLLDLASGDRLGVFQLSQLSGGGIGLREKPLVIRVGDIAEPREGSTADQLKVPAAANHRKAIQAALDYLLDPHRTKEQKDELVKLIAIAASRHNVMSRTWSVGGHVDRIISQNITAGLAYALWLVADGSFPFRAALCRCEFSQCGRYFLERRPGSGPGAPLRKHCTRDHGKKADTEKAKLRMQKRRDQEKRR